MSNTLTSHPTPWHHRLDGHLGNLGLVAIEPIELLKISRTPRFQVLQNGRVKRIQSNPGHRDRNSYRKAARREPGQARRERRDRLAEVVLAAELSELEAAWAAEAAPIDDFRLPQEHEPLPFGMALIDDSKHSRVTIHVENGEVVGAHAEDPQRKHPRKRRGRRTRGRRTRSISTHASVATGSRSRKPRFRHVDTW